MECILVECTEIEVFVGSGEAPVPQVNTTRPPAQTRSNWRA
jgi:aspartate/glutamate racemase